MMTCRCSLLPGDDQLRNSRPHVLLLLGVSMWAALAEVLVVEKVYDVTATGKSFCLKYHYSNREHEDWQQTSCRLFFFFADPVRHDRRSHVFGAVHGLWFSSGVRVRSPRVRHLPHRTLLKLLPQIVHQEEEVGEKRPCKGVVNV